MARAINVGPITPADELRQLLDINEKRAVNVRGSGAAVIDLLLDMDRIAELWPILEAEGADLRPEAGRWETLQAVVRRNARAIVREARAAGGMAAVRARQGGCVLISGREHPERSGGVVSATQSKDAASMRPLRPFDCGLQPSAQGASLVSAPKLRRTQQGGTSAGWWWTLDEQLRAEDRRRLARAVGVAALVLGVAVGIYFLLRVLFPVDPNLAAALEARNAGELKITQAGDFAGAAEDFRRATAFRPDDPETWLRLSIALEKSGDAAGAEEALARARALLPSELDLLLTRAPLYLALNLPDEAFADLQVAQPLAPEEPLIYLYQASVFESRQQYDQALAALEQANALVDERQQTQLAAMIRYRLAVVLQQAQMQSIFPPTPTP